jgi:hypothetical protein
MPIKTQDGNPGGGSGGSGGVEGSPSTPSVNPFRVSGAARDLNVVLSADGQSLILTLTPNDNDLYGEDPVSYRIYWLDPKLFSQQDVYSQNTGGVIGVSDLTIRQGRAKVGADLQGGSGIVTTTIAYLPYVTGGWMYAVVINGGKEYRLNGTNYVAVPGFNVLTNEPLVAEIPTNCLLQFHTLTGVNRLVQFSWRNPTTLSTAAYIKIACGNYLFDATYRDLVTYRINTGTGVAQGAFGTSSVASVDTQQSVTLEADLALGAHNITWYIIPLTSALVPLHLSACPNVVTTAIA